MVWWWEGKATSSSCCLYWSRNSLLIFPVSLVEEILFTHHLWHQFTAGDRCVCGSWGPHCFERSPALTCTVLLKGGGVHEVQYQKQVSDVSSLFIKRFNTCTTLTELLKWKSFSSFFLKQMKKHPCRQCDKSFSSSHSLCRHNRIKHKGIRKVYTCS